MLKHRLWMAGVGVIMGSLIARWISLDQGIVWIIGYLAFPMVWGYPRIDDETVQFRMDEARKRKLERIG